MKKETVDASTRRMMAGDRFAAHLGIGLEEVRPGWARAKMRLGKEHLNFLGMVHGGVVFSLADAAFAAASNSFGNKAVALAVSIDFLAAAEAGGELTAEVELLSRAGRMGNYSMQVMDPAGKIIARCSGWAYHTGRPHGEEA